MFTNTSSNRLLDRREYYPLQFRLGETDHWLIWFTDLGEDESSDGVWVDPDERIPVFDSLIEVDRSASQLGITLRPESYGLHDLDALASWLSNPRSSAVDCVAFLNAWNLFIDVAVSLQVTLRDRDAKARKVYEKLFWGNNLPAVTPEGCRYEPTWTTSDLVRMQQVLSRGLELFRSRIRAAKQVDNTDVLAGNDRPDGSHPINESGGD